jgi:hypothetical protein
MGVVIETHACVKYPRGAGGPLESRELISYTDIARR